MTVKTPPGHSVDSTDLSVPGPNVWGPPNPAHVLLQYTYSVIFPFLFVEGNTKRDPIQAVRENSALKHCHKLWKLGQIALVFHPG